MDSIRDESLRNKTTGPSIMQLHWDNNVERRGLGQLIRLVNHIAIIVSDVGRSTSFYTDVLGLQQINRPDFDRHGAWLTAGNVELHLIKGPPLVPDGENLIVPHIALDVDDPKEVFRLLREMGVPFEVNVSVPKGKGKAESEGGDHGNTLSQAFIRDPDGYYIEICNCNVLTDFALNLTGLDTEAAERKSRRLSQMYMEHAVPKLSPVSAQKIAMLAQRARNKVENLRRGDPTKHLSVEPLSPEQQPEEPDPVILANFCRRRQVYGDICQSFGEQELAEILLEAGNSAPKALLLMQRRIFLEKHPRLFYPPAYYVEAANASRGSIDEDDTIMTSLPRYRPQPMDAPSRRSTRKICMTAGLQSLADILDEVVACEDE